MDQPYHISLGHFLSFFVMISGRMKFLIFNIPLPNPDSQVSPGPRSSKLAGEDEICFIEQGFNGHDRDSACIALLLLKVLVWGTEKRLTETDRQLPSEILISSTLQRDPTGEWTSRNKNK